MPEAGLLGSMGAVLFVCVENTFRSVLAEALFNDTAPEGWRAESAGVQPAAAINPVVEVLLREVEIELEPKTPRLVTPEMIARADRVVTFGCLDRCPRGAEGKSEDWPVASATGRTPEELRAIRGEILDRVERLLAELRAARPR